MTPPQEANAAVLTVANLCVDVEVDGRDIEIVKNVSFTLEPGRVLGLIGESGSGKTLTAKSILRMLPGNAQARGEVRFEGRDLLTASEKTMRTLRGARVGAVFQDPLSSLNPVMRIGKQVMEALTAHRRMSPSQARAQAIELLTSVGIADATSRLDSFPHEFSGGMRQRVCIAMAIAHGPALLVADEPTTAVDVSVQAQILDTLAELRERLGLAVLLITHDIGVVAQVCDEVVVMRQGEVVEQGPTHSVLTAPQHPYTRALIAAAPSINDAGPTRVLSPEPVVELAGVGVTYGRGRARKLAVTDVTLTVGRGETVGLVGESGSGKTTVARVVAGFLDASAGRLTVDGQAVSSSREGQRRHSRLVQYVFQDPFASLDPRMTIMQSLDEALAFGGVPRGRREGRARELMDLVALEPEMLRRKPRAFSGGQRQRIVIARALAVEPRLLVCDEAVSALDVSVQAQVLRMLTELQQATGVGILFISHDLAVVRSISDRVVVMHNGVIVEQGPADDVYRRPRADYTRRLLAASPGHRSPAENGR